MYIILTPKCSLSVHISFLGKSNTNTWIFNLVGKINVFLKARIVAMIYYMVVKWAPPKNLMKFILNPSPSKLKGQSWHFGRYAHWLRSLTYARKVCWISPVESCTTMILSGGKRPHTNWKMLAENACKIERSHVGFICTWHTLGSSWDHLPKTCSSKP